MTSSDVLDTCFNVQLVRAADILIADVDQLLAALKRRAFEHKKTPTIGRSHGIHAEPTTFGRQARGRLCRILPRPRAARAPRARRSRPARSPARSAPSPRSIRGSRRTSPRRWGCAVEPVSTQIIPRDRHAMYFATLGVVASSMERLAIEIRHLQRTEVLEAEEFFSAGQKGSSAMPHKRNPVLTREPHRPRPHGARLCAAGDGERRALARARHLAFLGRAHDRARRHGDARLRAQPARRRHRQARGLSGEHAARTSTGSAAWSIRSAC